MSIQKQLENLSKNNELFGTKLAEETKDFMALHDKALEDGALTPKVKELIALGIAIAVKCDGCILSHVSTLVEMGVTEEEIVETVGVSFFMGGGPSMVYGGKALEVYKELTE